MIRYSLLLLMTVLAASGQGTEPKKIVTEYPVHTTVGKVSIGAENWGHGLTTSLGSFTLNDYIAIEVAIYADHNEPLDLNAGYFQLRINGKGTPLMAQSTGSVIAALKYPDWERQNEMTVGGGVGDQDVMLGRRPQVERFPGDPRGQAPAGNIPKIGVPTPGGVEKRPVTPEKVIGAAALPEGIAHPPVSGFIFFLYKGKLKSLKKMELLYDGPTGAASLVLP